MIRRIPFFLLMIAATALQLAGAKECADCHSGQDRDAGSVTVPKLSAHDGLECGECHGGLKTADDAKAQGKKVHGDKPRKASCKACHADEVTAVGAATHGAKLKTVADQEGKTSPVAVCLLCHGGDAHAILADDKPTSPINRAKIAETCLGCHAKVLPGATNYLTSVHGLAVAAGRSKAAVCTDCHGSHSIVHSSMPGSSVYHTNIPQTCGKCHAVELGEYNKSVHWEGVSRGLEGPPVCTDCHGEHVIRSPQDPSSPTFAGNVTRTCAACHESERITTQFHLQTNRLESFKASFHGLYNEMGDLRAANCGSCHGNHMVLPQSDPRSTVNPANMGKTCGHCHPGAETHFVGGRIHVTPETPSHWSVTAVRLLYFCLIALTIGGMLIHNLLDVRYKRKKGEPYHRLPGLTPRFSVNERIQHALLALSFILLAVSGFALRFPNSVFAWPFHWFAAASDIRRGAHRECAVVFVLLAAYHFCYLLLTRRGRVQLKALWPRFQDAKDVRNVLLKYLGRCGEALHVPTFCYVEKAEYWALIWGGTVMTVTGAVLLFINVSLATVPLWVVDLTRTIHFWEAVLAVLAIIVWHGYWVSLDPDIFPLNRTFLTGDPHPPKSDAPPEVP